MVEADIRQKAFFRRQALHHSLTLPHMKSSHAVNTIQGNTGKFPYQSDYKNDTLLAGIMPLLPGFLYR